MKKKNGKGKKKKIVGIVCLVFVVLFAGTLVSAYSMFKTRFYDTLCSSGVQREEDRRRGKRYSRAFREDL